MSDGKEITRREKQAIERTSPKSAVAPPVDIFENDDEVLVVADIPGVASDGVKLNFENNQLTIEASTSWPEVEGSPLFREFGDVDYARAFNLAPGIDAERISAELNEGTLRIHLPKSAALKPRRIPIAAG